MELEKRVEELIQPTLNAMGYEVVRVLLSGKHNPTLQIMAEPSNGGPMTVDDCAEISRAVSAVLDVEDPIKGAYQLEVSSPGLDRPLTRRQDFERYAGFEARVETQQLIDGRRRFKGRLDGIDGDDVLLEVEGIAVRIPLAQVYRAKLVLTDELIAAYEEERTP
jgi:ribosome maturation factor RimP